MKVLISGGGTGGHVTPAISLAQSIEKKYPNTEFLFVGTENGLEKRVVPTYGYPIQYLSVQGIKGKNLFSRLKALFLLIIAFFKALKLLVKFRPDFIYGVGGYASAPCILAGFVLRKPIFLLEQNTVPGITNRFLQIFCKKIFISFDHSKRFFNPQKTILSGTPLKEEFYLHLRKAKEEQSKSSPKNEKTIFILGGSQGAKPINDIIKKIMLDIDFDHTVYNWIHQTGSRQFIEMKNFYQEHGINNVKCFDFLNNLSHYFAMSDLIITRAGAATIFEIIAAQKPSILIPFPQAADDHQTLNAKSLSNIEAGILLPQDRMTVDVLGHHIKEVLNEETLSNKLKTNLAQIYTKEPASIIIENSLP